MYLCSHGKSPARPRRIGIVSDDLTGSNTAAGRIAEILNMHSRVIWLSSELYSSMIEDGVTSINTESRTADRSSAIRQVKNAVKWLQDSSVDWIFKRFDSHLRGHLGAEVRAFLESRDLQTVFVVAAYPGTGKSTVSGIQLNQGVPVSETNMRFDPTNAVTESHIPTILSNQGLSVELITLEWEKQSNDVLVQQLVRAAKAANVVVCDARTDAHLFRISCALASEGMERCLGNFGIACSDMQLAGYFVLNYLAKRDYERNPVVSVVGSITDTVHKQIDFVQKHAGIACLEFDVSGVSLDIFLEKVRKSLRESRDVVIHTGQRKDVSPKEARALTARLGQAIKAIVFREGIRALLIVGGETANEVCKSLDTLTLQELKQLETGVTYANLLTMGGISKSVILRSGSVGDETALAKHMLRLII